MRIVEAFPFRILRNADIDYEHEQDEDLLDVKSIIEQGVRERRFGNVVRLSVPAEISERMLKRLMSSLEVPSNREVYAIEGELGSADLFEVLRRRPARSQGIRLMCRGCRRPSPKASTSSRSSANRMSSSTTPYDSFAPVEDFFKRAARDPAVLAIKATLYRVGKNSPVVNALMDARDNEKQVTVLVELKARFDEENNLEWVTALEEKGVHVVLWRGRAAGQRLMPKSRWSSAASAMACAVMSTSARAITTPPPPDSIPTSASSPATPSSPTTPSRLFNRLTGYAPDTNYSRLLVAPEYLHDSLVALIDNEIAARPRWQARPA